MLTPEIAEDLGELTLAQWRTNALHYKIVHAGEGSGARIP